MIQVIENVCRTIITFLVALQVLQANKCHDCNLYGKPGDGYYIAVNIGSPKQNFNLLIDTGSSNLAIAGASYPGLKYYYLPNNSDTFRYQYNGSTVKVMYTQGWWEGFMGKDLVEVPSLKYVKPVFTDLAIITKTHGFYVNNSHWQGILGLAYSEIAKPEGLMTSWLDSLSESFPNVTNHRFDLELCGPKAYPHRDTHYGKFSLGNVVCRKTRFTTPLPHRWYYEVLVTGVKVGDRSVEIPCSDFNTPKTIVDSGTSNLQFSSRSYDSVIYHLREQVEEHSLKFSDEFWLGKEEICLSHLDKGWDVFPSLTIFLNHDEDHHFGIRIPSTAYLRPSLNRTSLSPVVNRTECWLFGIEKAEIGTVLGTVALEGFCLVFDRKKGLISFVESTCGPNVTLTPIQKKADGTTCKYVVKVINGPLIASSVILTIVLLPLLAAFLRCVWMEMVKPKMGSSLPFISLDETNT